MKKIIFTLAAATLMASCTKTELINYPAGEAEGAAIQARSKHNGVKVTGTRQPFDNPIAEDNELTARILTFRADGTLWADGTMTFANETNVVAYNTGATKTKFGADKAEEYTMYGFYPAASPAWTLSDDTDTDTEDGTVSITFTGKEDVMIAPVITTTSADQQAGTYNMLSFGHQLTKLVLAINAEDEAAGTEWGELKSVIVKRVGNSADNLKPTLTCALEDGTVSFGGTPASFNFYSYDGTDYSDDLYSDNPVEIAFNDTDEDDNAIFTTVAYTMVAPFTTTAANDVVLEVTAETSSGTDRVIEVPVELTTAGTGDSTKGYAYTIKLTFDMNIIKAKAEVTEWEDGGDEEKTVV